MAVIQQYDPNQRNQMILAQMLMNQPQQRQQPAGGSLPMPPTSVMGSRLGGGGPNPFTSSAGSLGWMGPAAAIAAAVALTKGREARSSGTENKLWRTFNAPSGAQIKDDPRLAAMWATGLGPLSPWLGIGKSGANVKPEWEQLFGL